MNAVRQSLSRFGGWGCSVLQLYFEVAPSHRWVLQVKFDSHSPGIKEQASNMMMKRSGFGSQMLRIYALACVSDMRMYGLTRFNRGQRRGQIIPLAWRQLDILLIHRREWRSHPSPPRWLLLFLSVCCPIDNGWRMAARSSHRVPPRTARVPRQRQW